MITLTRDLHLTNPLQHGPDVGQIQHLLTAKGFPVIADYWFGPQTGAACVEAKKRLRYVKANQTPTCGQALVDQLEAHKPWPPPPPPSPQAQRVKYVAAWRQAISQHANWDYAQVRPIPHPPHPGRIVTDCSGAVTYLAQLCGLPDPNGLRYNGGGYTGTLLDHCSQITRWMLKPADLVVFGAFPGHHVCAVLNVSDDPMLGSHGRQGDPREISLSVEAASQAARGHSTVTYLRWLP